MGRAPTPLMRHSLRLGRLFGIELRIDSSWIFIFVLVVWSLSSLFAAWHPDWPLGTSLIVAVVAAIFFFGSVLFHELAHSLLAKLYGIEVRDITLFLFGGVSNIEREPPTPGAEFLIAVVGPLASVALGVIFLVLGSVATGITGANVDAATPAESLARMGPATTALMWLGPINILVGVFNLIPGFPLDGGRVLRSIVWKVTGDLGKATRVSAVVGQMVGWGFIVTGIFMVFGYRVPFFGSGLGGIWLALIGLFLRNAAAQHYAGAAVQEALAGVRVRDLMRTQGAWVDANVQVRALVEQFFLRHDDRAFPVYDGSTFVGLVCLDDVRRSAPAEWDTRTVRDVISPGRTTLCSTPSAASAPRASGSSRSYATTSSSA